MFYEEEEDLILCSVIVLNLLPEHECLCGVEKGRYVDDNNEGS